MIGTALVLGLIAAGQPLEFHAAVGMEPDRECVLDVHRRYSQNGVVTQEQAWRVVVRFSRDEAGTWVAACRRTLTGEAEQRLRDAGVDPAQVEDAEPTLEFELSPDGGVARLRNWEDLREQTRAAAETRRLNLLHEGRLTLQEAMDDAVLVREMTKSHDVVFDSQGLGFVPYLEGYGWTLAEGEPEVRARHVPNITGGDRASVQRTVALRDDPKTIGLIEYAATDQIDEATLRRELARILEAGRDELERQFAEAGEELPQDLEERLMEIRMADSIAWVYSMESGRVASARRVRELRGAGQDVVEEVVWELAGDGSDEGESE